MNSVTLTMKRLVVHRVVTAGVVPVDVSHQLRQALDYLRTIIIHTIILLIVNILSLLLSIIGSLTINHIHALGLSILVHLSPGEADEKPLGRAMVNRFA
jgi:hypothetical protein